MMHDMCVMEDVRGGVEDVCVARDVWPIVDNV